MSQTPRSQVRLHDDFPLKLRNVSGETIPGHAAMVAAGVASKNYIGDKAILVTKFNGSNARSVLINSPLPIPPDGDGSGTRDGPFLVRYDEFAPVAPQVGDTWGLVNGQWHVAANSQQPIGVVIEPGQDEVVWMDWTTSTPQQQTQAKRFELGGQHRKRGEPADNLIGWSLDLLGNRVEQLSNIYDFTGDFGGQAGASNPEERRGSFGIIEQVSVAFGSVWAITQLANYPMYVIATAKGDGKDVLGEVDLSWKTENHTLELPYVSQGDPRIEIDLRTSEGFDVDLKEDKKYFALLLDETQDPPWYEVIAFADEAAGTLFQLPQGSSIPARSALTLGSLEGVKIFKREEGLLVDTGDTMTAYNASPVPIHADSQDAYLAAVGGIASSQDLSNLADFDSQSQMHISICVSGQPKWQPMAPVTSIRYEHPNLQQFICGSWSNWHTTNPCPEE